MSNVAFAVGHSDNLVSFSCFLSKHLLVLGEQQSADEHLRIGVFSTTTFARLKYLRAVKFTKCPYSLLRRRQDAGGREECGEIGLSELLILDLLILPRDGTNLELLRRKGSRVHRLRHNLNGQPQGAVKVNIILILRLKDAIRSSGVAADRRRAPPAEIARRIALIQLEAVVPVPSGEEEADAERPEAAPLRVRLLGVADELEEVLNGDGLVVGVGVALGGEARLVDEDVRVGGDAGHGAGNVGVDDVHLFRPLRRVEELRRRLLLGGEDDTLARQDTYGGARVADSLHRILYLEEAAVGGESTAEGGETC